MGRILQVVVKGFQLTCFLLAGFMTYLQFERYLQNGDVSTISFRTFNSDTRDIYPSFSMCLKGLNGEIFRHTEIVSIWNHLDYEKGVKMYQDGLRGNSNFSNAVIEKTFENVTVDFLKDAFTSLETYTKEGEVRKNQNFLVYKSYQDYKYICYTRDVMFEKDLLIQKDEVMLNPEFLINQKLPLLIFLHEKGKLTQDLLSGQEPFIKLKYEDFEELFNLFEQMYGSKTFYTVDIRINQVETLRKRIDSVDPCHDDTLHTEDQEWILRVIKDVGCIPTFWKSLVLKITKQNLNELKLDSCTTPSEYGSINNYTSRYNTMKKLKPTLKPCTQTLILANMDIYYLSAEKHEFLVKIIYNNEEYKEIVNGKGFNDETLLSTVGGYIGIFLGISLLQLPSILDAFVTWIKSNKALGYTPATGRQIEIRRKLGRDFKTGEEKRQGKK